MLHIVCIFYLLSLANGLALLALDGMVPAVAGPEAGGLQVEIAPQAAVLARYSLPLLGAGMALMGLLQHWKDRW
jgi:hypothetical protein